MSPESIHSKVLEDFCEEIIKITGCTDSDLDNLIDLLSDREQAFARKDSE